MLPAGTAWRGLLLDVRATDVPGLRVEAAPPHHLRVTQGRTPLLWAVVSADHCKVTWCRSGAWQPVVAPVRADQARRRSQLEDVEWWQSWAHWFVDRMESSSAGPLSNGTWALRPAALSGTKINYRASSHLSLETIGPDEGLVTQATEGELDWFRGDDALLPLHDLPSPDESRVKAYRKRVRDGSLTPVLSWWVSALDCHVVLDGHARLVAALAEEIEPPILALTAIREPAEVSPAATGESFYEERRDRIYAHGGAGTPHAAAIEQLVAEAQLRREEQAVTPGWPLSGGLTAWTNEVAQLAPNWQWQDH